MNIHNLAVSLLATKTVSVVFQDPGKPNIGSIKEYVYCVPDYLEVDKDDYCLVNDVHGHPAIVRIMEVHDDLEIDTHAVFDYKWIVASLNEDKAADLVAKVEKVKRKLTAQRRQNARDQALAMLGTDAKGLKELINE